MHHLPAFLIAGLIAIYLIPAVIAGVRRHRHWISIALLNLLLGWTAFFWIVAFIWAVTV